MQTQHWLELKPISETWGVTVGTTIVGLPGLPNGAKLAMISFESFGAYARFDATNTVTSGGTGRGLPMTISTIYEYYGWDTLNRMRMVGNGGVGFINAVYFGAEQPGDTA